MSQEQQRQNGDFTWAQSFNLFFFLVRTHSLCFLVFLRKGMGREEPGIPGLAALAMMLAVGAFGKSTEMLVFAGIWLVFLAGRRVETMRMVKQGMRWHSRSPGYPEAVMTWFRVKNPDFAIRFVEPLLLLALGSWAYFATDTVLGGFMIAGCFSLVLRNGIERTIITRRAIAMEDARIEQEHLIRMFNEKDY